MRAFVAILVIVGAIGVSGLVARVMAQDSPIPADATPGAFNVAGTMLGSVEPAIAPGYRLVMAETVFSPGAFVTEHIHPTAIVVCVQSGALGFAIQHGSAVITRGGSEATPESTESLALNTNVTLEPRDCVSFDHFAMHTSHTGWNASDGPTVLWEARLLKIDEPFTTFIDAAGTPVP